MNSKILIFGALFAMVLLFGCIDEIKEMVQLPFAGTDMETDDFTQTITPSDNESLEVQGVYAIITTDDAQIQDIIYTASFEGVEIGSEVSFLGSIWTVTVLDCTNKEIGLSKEGTSLTLKDGSVENVDWEVFVSCSNGELNSIKLDLNRALIIIKGEVMHMPDSYGYTLEYLGKGVLEIK